MTRGIKDSSYKNFEQRKQDHIALALKSSNQASDLNVLDRFSLIHEALPDMNFSEINISGQRFGRYIEKPFIVSSMTAGHRDAIHINQNLMEACALSKWAMGVGSQRRELTDHTATKEWHNLRKKFPTVALFSNLGIAQIIGTPLTKIQCLIEALQAEALIIHCNPLQEVLQPEGTTEFKGCWQALAKLVEELAIPVVIKETGCGFSMTTLQRLNDIGVAAVDVSGLGGTHWGRIEGQRAQKNSIQYNAAISFRSWGIDTLQSIKNAMAIRPNFEIWGSGGVRNGLDAAKLFALGANVVAFAKLMLQPALEDYQAVYTLMLTIEYELRVAMFCTGSNILTELREKICH